MAFMKWNDKSATSEYWLPVETPIEFYHFDKTPLNALQDTFEQPFSVNTNMCNLQRKQKHDFTQGRMPAGELR